MESLMAALVAALLIRATDKSAALVAVSAERSGKSGAVLLATLIALVITLSLAAMAGLFIGPRLTPNATRLMLALSLVAAASGAVWPGKTKDMAEVRHPFWSTLTNLTVTGLGGRTEFVVFAVAAWGTAALAGVGGLIGSMAILGAAAVAGETLWRPLPHRAIGIVAGGVLVVAGAWLAVSALRLI
jgi:putative Ca2+/H+ antiporter (TMEM165/GDT1 family)